MYPLIDALFGDPTLGARVTDPTVPPAPEKPTRPEPGNRDVRPLVAGTLLAWGVCSSPWRRSASS
jgi:hypothetical protein